MLFAILSDVLWQNVTVITRLCLNYVQASYYNNTILMLDEFLMPRSWTKP